MICIICFITLRFIKFFKKNDPEFIFIIYYLSINKYIIYFIWISFLTLLLIFSLKQINKFYEFNVTFLKSNQYQDILFLLQNNGKIRLICIR